MKCFNKIDVDGFSEILSALSQPNRLQIICLLKKNGELCVCKIIEFLGLKQNLVSHHLNILKKIGLLKSKREGKNIHYSLEEKNYKKFKKNLETIF